MQLGTSWCTQLNTFPLLAKTSLEVLVQFATTSLRESSSSTLLYIKTKARNLYESDDDIQVAISNEEPCYSMIIEKKVTFLTRVCNFLQLHNSPVDWATDLFKHSTDSASLLAYFEKKLGGFGVLCGWRHNGSMSSRFYDWSYLALRANPTGHIFGLKFFFLESRLSSDCLEPLFGLLAYLDAKLWPKKQKF